MSHDDHASHDVNYVYVFGALCVFTALSFFADIFNLRALFGYWGLVVIVMAIAVAKALCVMMFFMHLKFEGNWKFVLLAPTTILAIGLPLALLPDIGVHYYTDVSPQKLEAAANPDTGHVDGEGAEHGDH